MAYTIYKNEKVLNIKTEKVVRQRRPQEIADPIRRRPDYSVSVATIENIPYDVTISDLKRI